jgi:hypothetical protein
MLMGADHFMVAVELAGAGYACQIHPRQMSEGAEEVCDQGYEAMFGHAATPLPRASPEENARHQTARLEPLIESAELTCTECGSVFSPHQTSEGMEGL